MPNQGKRESGMTESERFAKITLWSAQSAQMLKRIRLSSEEAAAFLGISIRSLEAARSIAKEAVDSGEDIDPNHESSIPFRDGSMIQYSAFHLLEFFDRAEFTVGGGRRMPDHLKGPRKKEETANSIAGMADFLGKCARNFMGWMQTASTVETWPFSIQNDGRPIDLHTAYLEEKLTGKAERLNLREFSERLANVAVKTFAEDAHVDIGSGTPDPMTVKATLADRSDVI